MKCCQQLGYVHYWNLNLPIYIVWHNIKAYGSDDVDMGTVRVASIAGFSSAAK